MEITEGWNGFELAPEEKLEYYIYHPQLINSANYLK